MSSEPKYHVPTKPSLPHVDSIIEDEEPKENMHLTQDVRSRPEAANSPDPRARSVSASRIYHSGGPRVIRKSSLGIKSAPVQSGLPGRDMYDWQKSTTPQGVRRIQRNHQSKGVADVIYDSEEGDGSNRETSDQTAQGRSRLYPVSKATNDLISFLEDGPPPEIQPVRSATLSATSLTPTTKSAKSGNRLQRMISKLSLTKEDRVLQDGSRGRGIGIRSVPSTPISSLRSFGDNDPPPVPFAMKPVPPPVTRLAPISPPSSRTSSAEDDTLSLTSRTNLPRKLSVRKAVPTWESTVDQGLQTPHTGGEKALPQSPPTPAHERKDTNGITHNNKVLRSESPSTTPTPEAHPDPLTRDNGNGGAGHQYPQGINRPKTSRPSIRSSSNDEQIYSSRRSSGRRSQPPNGTVDHSQQIHPSLSLSEALALDLRKLMSQATTADECRLLVDTFLTRVGIVPPPDLSPAFDSAPSDVEPLEQTLVNYFLSADLDGSQFPHTRSVQAEVECHSTPKQVQEGDDAHLRTATPINSENAVHTHHIVSNAVQ